MSADVKRGIVEDFFLHELLLLVLAEFSFEEVEGRVGFLKLHWPLLPLLLLENRTQVSVLPVILAAVHLY